MIEVNGLVKSYRVWRRVGTLRRVPKVVTAVDDVSFQVRSGEVIGLLGPNGAGKSTTLKLLTGLLIPTTGRVSVLGLDPTRQRRALVSRIGVMFGQRVQLWWDLPLRDSFEILRHLYAVPPAEHARRVATLTEVLELAEILPVPVRELSLGQRMRGELAAAFLHGPELVILDEPTIGLDIVTKPRLREFLRTLVAQTGVTTLVTTHDLADIEQLCTRLIVLDRGQLIFDGPTDALVERYGRHRTLVVDLDASSPPLDLGAGYETWAEDTRQWIRFDRGERTAAEAIAAVTLRAQVRDLTIQEPGIEEVVRAIYAAQRA